MPRLTRKKMSGKSSGKNGNGNGKNNVVVFFLTMLNTIKMYHWQTFSYPQHKATDDLYASIGDLTDKFVEVLLGKSHSRFTLPKSFTLKVDNYTNINKLVSQVEQYKKMLVNIESYLPRGMSNTDLLNIRDELLGDLNKFLYLLTLK